MATPNEKLAEKLRAAWSKAIEKDRPKDAAEALAGLERLEPKEPRWPQRLGDTYKRLGRSKDAEAAYERAMRLFASQGFFARAVALAKTIATLNPARAGIVDEVDPDAARALRRQSRSRIAAAPVVAEDEPRPAPPAPAPRPAPPAPRSAAAATEAEETVDDADILDADALEPKGPVEVLAKSGGFRALATAADVSDDEIRFTDLDESTLDVEGLESELTQDVDAAPDTAVDDDVTVGDTAGARTPLGAERLALLSGAALFGDVGEATLAELVRSSLVEHRDPGQVVFTAGEPAVDLFVIVEGSVRLELARSAPGTSALDLGEGQVFGEGCLLESARRLGTALTLTTTTLLRIPKAALDARLPEEPGLAQVLFELLVRRLLSNVLQTAPMFLAFDVETRTEIARLFEVRRAPAGTVLAEAGKRADGLYIPLAGDLVAQASGRSEPVPLGSAFGHEALLGLAPCQRTLVVRREALLLRLPARRFTALATHYPPALAELARTAG